MPSDARAIAVKSCAYVAGAACGAVLACVAREATLDDVRSLPRALATLRTALRRVLDAIDAAAEVEGDESDRAKVVVARVDEEEVDEELERTFHRCAKQFKNLLIDANAYFEPGLKAKMYGLYKRCESDFARDAVKPMNRLDVVGRAKYEAWASVKNLSRREAMETYVRTFREWGEKQDAQESQDAVEIDEEGYTEADRKAAEEFHAEDGQVTEERVDSEWSMGGRQSQPVFADDDADDEALQVDPIGSLIAACKMGDEDAAMLALKGGADVNERDAHGRTPLHWCADGGHVKLAMHLALLQADVNAQDDNGQTPLHFSVHLEDADTANLLLDWGADPSITDSQGDTPESLGLWEITGERQQPSEEDE